MAEELLRRRAEAAAAAAATMAKSSQAWLDALPEHVDLCWLYWTDAELAELQDEDTLAEARHLRAVYEAACEVKGRRGAQDRSWVRSRPRPASPHPRPPFPLLQELGRRYSRADMAWALSLVHSRSFVMQSAHWWIPGIDMCNHSLACNADIRCVRADGQRGGRRSAGAWRAGRSAACAAAAPPTPSAPIASLSLPLSSLQLRAQPRQLSGRRRAGRGVPARHGGRGSGGALAIRAGGGGGGHCGGRGGVDLLRRLAVRCVSPLLRLCAGWQPPRLG